MLAMAASCASAQDWLRSEFTADEAARAVRDARIAPLERVRANVRAQYTVVQFFNSRLIADADREPIVYCVSIETPGGSRMMVHVDPFSGRVYPDQDARNEADDNPCAQRTDVGDARTRR